MTAAKISLRDGARRALMFSFGVCIVVLLQTYIASILSRYLSQNQDIVDILQRVAFVIFILITIYFLVLASQKKEAKLVEAKIRSKRSHFFNGILLSALNLFPIPYQAYMTTTIASFGWINFEQTSIISYVAGSGTGTFVMLYIYTFFIDKLKGKTFTSQKNMNYIIGTITGLVALSTLISIIKEL